MAMKRLSLAKGNNDTYTVTFNQSTGLPYCIKNWVVYFTLKTHYSLPDSKASLLKTISVFSDTTSGTTGVAVIPITPADTEHLDPGEYDFDIMVKTAADDIHTVLKGKFDLEYVVTHGTSGTAGT
jgi:hypothetical protein